jgi:hypothetical protein
MKHVKTERCHYKLKENQIKDWLNHYGKIKGQIHEEAMIDEVEFTSMDTGAYLVNVDLSKRLPSWLPMFGQKVKLFHEGINKS